MCDLCDEKTKVQAHKNAHAFANRLRNLAAYYDGMGSGLIKPHSDESKQVAAAGRLVVRQLVEDWV